MLNALEITDFKSFRRGHARLGAFALIVGTNAAGKSNIREALRVLHGIGLGYSIADILGEKYGPGGVLQWRGIRGGAREACHHGADCFSLLVEVTVAAGDNGSPQVLEYRVDIDVTDPIGGSRVVREHVKQGDSFIFDSHPKDDPIEQTAPHELRVRLPRGGNNRNHGKALAFSSARPALTQLAEQRNESPQVRAACAAVAEAFASMRFLDLDPDAMRQPSQPGQIILGDRGENLSSVLQGICHDMQKRTTLLEWVRALTPMDATDFVFRPDLLGRVLVYLRESSGFEVSAYSASDGTLRFLALVAALLSPDTGRIYFFEEFDNGIHPTRLHLLLDLVQSACRTLEVQVIGTTHNPALLAFLDAKARNDALLVHRPDANAGSVIVRIMGLPGAQEIVASQDLGRLHQAGWLEDAAIFSAPDSEEELSHGR